MIISEAEFLTIYDKTGEFRLKIDMERRTLSVFKINKEDQNKLGATGTLVAIFPLQSRGTDSIGIVRE